MKIKRYWLCLAALSLPVFVYADAPFRNPAEVIETLSKSEVPPLAGESASPKDFDLSRYKLSPADVRSMEYLINSGEYSVEKLDRFAKSYEKAARERRPWVPPATIEEVDAVVKWAEGAAFASYASKAGYSFDSEAYNKDCPYRILFNYGYATSHRFFGRDVISAAINTMTDLNFKFQKGEVDFPAYFYDLAVKRGFAKYLGDSPPTT